MVVDTRGDGIRMGRGRGGHSTRAIIQSHGRHTATPSAASATNRHYAGARERQDKGETRIQDDGEDNSRQGTNPTRIPRQRQRNSSARTKGGEEAKERHNATRHIPQRKRHRSARGARSKHQWVWEQTPHIRNRPCSPAQQAKRADTRQRSRTDAQPQTTRDSASKPARRTKTGSNLQVA